MKWTAFGKNGEERPPTGPLSVDREAIAVLSQQISSTIRMPACIRAALIASERSGTALELSLQGGLILGGLGVELIFRSAPTGKPAFPRDLTTKATLLPGGQALELRGRSPRTKVGTDPAAWVQARNGNGTALTDSTFIGRLGRGPCLLDPAFLCPVTAETYISPFGLGAPSESNLTLTGELTFDEGLTLRVALRRREGALWWGRRPDAILDFEIAPPGTMIHFPAQPIWTGESAGLLKSLIFLDGEGEPIGNEQLLAPDGAVQ